jgi:hypothetical protein
MAATANKIEEVSADMAGPTPALQDKAAVPDEPVQPKPLFAAAIGALIGLVIGIAVAWWLAARQRVRPNEDMAESQAHADDPVEQLGTDEPPPHMAADVGSAATEILEPPQQAGSSPTSTIGQPRQSARRSTRWRKILICCQVWRSGWNLSTRTSRRSQRSGYETAFFSTRWPFSSRPTKV